MGLFEKAGRRFEQFKQEATAAAKQDAEYECQACGNRLFTDADQCPECGAEELTALDGGDAADGTDAAEPSETDESE